MHKCSTENSLLIWRELWQIQDKIQKFLCVWNLILQTNYCLHRETLAWPLGVNYVFEKPRTGIGFVTIVGHLHLQHSRQRGKLGMPFADYDSTRTNPYEAMALAYMNSQIFNNKATSRDMDILLHWNQIRNTKAIMHKKIWWEIATEKRKQARWKFTWLTRLGYIHVTEVGECFS